MENFGEVWRIFIRDARVNSEGLFPEEGKWLM